MEQFFYFMELTALLTKHSNQSPWTNAGKRCNILLYFFSLCGKIKNFTHNTFFIGGSIQPEWKIFGGKD